MNMCGSAIKKITNIVKKVDPLRGGDVLTRQLFISRQS